MNIYSTDIAIYATVYVRAKDEIDAKTLIRSLDGEFLTMPQAEVGMDIEMEISAAMIGPDLPDMSLSPAMTIHVEENDIASIQLADEGEDDEEETE
jgi:hypothetical protein